MNTFDWIVIGCLVLCAGVGALKGFMKMLLKTGATVGAVVLAGIFGKPLGSLILPEVIKYDGEALDSSARNAIEGVNSMISSVVGTVILFVVLFIVLKIVASIVARKLVDSGNLSAVDRILGAVVGALGGVAVLYCLATIFKTVTIVIAFVSGDHSATIPGVSDSVLFGLFM